MLPSSVACTMARRVIQIKNVFSREVAVNVRTVLLFADGRNSEEHETYVVDSTAVGCRSCCCSNGKVAKNSNEESEVEYSPPPGVGFSFACCHPSLCHQTDGFQMLVDSGSSKHFVDSKLVHRVESRKQGYTQISPPVEIKDTGHNALLGITQGTLLIVDTIRKISVELQNCR